MKVSKELEAKILAMSVSLQRSDAVSFLAPDPPVVSEEAKPNKPKRPRRKKTSELSAQVEQPQVPIQSWPTDIFPSNIIASVVFIGNPLPKERPRMGKGGRVFTPQRTVEYEAKIASLLKECVGDLPVDSTSEFGLRCRFFRGDRRRVDCDNLIKAVSDAANGIAWGDDSQIVEVMGKLIKGCREARAEILVYRIRD